MKNRRILVTGAAGKTGAAQSLEAFVREHRAMFGATLSAASA